MLKFRAKIGMKLNVVFVLSLHQTSHKRIYHFQTL